LDLVRENIARHKIELFQGVASIEDPCTVRVSGGDGDSFRLRGKYILISTGSRPYRPAHVPFDGEYVYDSDSILRLKRIPSSLLVIGAGVIGSEYTTVFAALGVPVTLVDGRERLLGVHIIGERACELIHIGQACIYFGGTIDFFIQNVFNFPTLSDVYKYAAYDGLANLQRARERQKN